MTSYCKQNLNEIKKLVLQVTTEQYIKPSILLSGATIGQHIRHILEFYQCLIHGIPCGTVNYDNRERNLGLETDRSIAIECIDHIINLFNEGLGTEKLSLEGNFSSGEEQVIVIDSSLLRELAYNLEHSIHHQALIKIGLIEQELGHLIDADFGVAPATIRFKQQKDLASYA